MAGPSSLRAPNNYFADCETFHVRVTCLMLHSGAELILSELDNAKTAAGGSTSRDRLTSLAKLRSSSAPHRPTSSMRQVPYSRRVRQPPESAGWACTPCP